MPNTEFPLAPHSSILLYIIAVLPLSIALFLIYMSWSVNRVSMSVSGDKLTLSGVFYGRTLDKQELKVSEARQVDVTDKDRELRPVSRRNGVGLSGFQYGWFKLANGEKSLLLLSDKRRAVYIPTTKGYSLLVSPKDPEAFMAALKGK